MSIDINQILSSLTPDDINSLKSAAAGLIGGAQEQPPAVPENKTPVSATEGQLMQLLSSVDAGGQGLPDISKLAALAPVLSALGKKDERTDFLTALKPLLSEERRSKADEAAKLLKLMSLLPLLREQGIL